MTKAESILYKYCCETITAKACKAKLRKLGFKVDLRVWIHNTIQLEDIVTGQLTRAEV